MTISMKISKVCIGIIVLLVVSIVVHFQQIDKKEIHPYKISPLLKAKLTAESNKDSEPLTSAEELSQDVIDGIKKLVMFLGYGRSGHSIIGSLMDAHPHVVISNEFHLLEHYEALMNDSDTMWRNHLFNSLYEDSVKDAHGSLTYTYKGYTLAVQGLWQGGFDQFIEVIGDKGAGRITTDYLKDKFKIIKNFLSLERSIGIPIRIIHVVRNPFDMIATATVILNADAKILHKLKNSFANEGKKPKMHKYNRPDLLNKWINDTFDKFDAVKEMTSIFGKEKVLEVHNCDLVNDPKGTISRIFRFLEVATTEHYLEVCAQKVFKSVSRSRNTVVWSAEQISMVEQRMKNYAILSRYSFTSD